MLDFFRSHQRLMQLLLLVVIVPSFAFFGIEGYTRFVGNVSNLAEVDGKPISQGQFDNALRQQKEQMRAVLGEGADPRLLDTPERRRLLLDTLIEELVVGNEISRLNLTVSDNALRDYMQSLPGIAHLRKPDGSFDLESYTALLAQQGLTPDQYDEQVRFGLAGGRLNGIVRGSGFVARTQAESLVRVLEQEREIQERVLSPADFVAGVAPSEASMRAHYEAIKGAQFTSPEEVKVEYLVLSAEHFAKKIVVTDAMARHAYDANVLRYQKAEQRRASHILIAVAKEAKPDERAAALARAEKLLIALRAQPEHFAQLAKENSNDPGSAAQGGDLGFFGRGMMVPSFDEAAFKLKKGELSSVVESGFGFHIIRMTDIKLAQPKPFDEVKDEIVEGLKREQAAKEFNEAAEAFTNLVYEQYASLAPAAEKFGLPLMMAEHITRAVNPNLAKDNVLNSEKFLSAIFSDDVVKNKRNTEALAVAPHILVAARVVAHQPALVRPFDTVRDVVRAQLVASMAADLARSEGKKLLAQSPNVSDMGVARWVDRRSVTGGTPAAVAAIFRADTRKLPVMVGVDLGERGYVLYKINQVRQPEVLDAATVKTVTESLSSEGGSLDYRAYLDTLRARAKVKNQMKDAGEVNKS
ncbi:MAG: SurA N-terminal domain-containing protein [Ottowia sp.]|nr:SurA N-terminal domain-containing protein [Ottowia sp.]